MKQEQGAPGVVPSTPVVSPSAVASPTGTGSPAATKTPGSKAQPGDLVHVVQQGETLYRIAINYDVDVDDLAEINGITDKSYIKVGQTLMIPKGGVKPTPTKAGPTATAPAATATPVAATPTSAAPSPTPTATTAPTSTATPAPTATPTPTVSPLEFAHLSTTSEPNCGLTAIGGKLSDGQGNGVPGYRIVAGYDAEGAWSATTQPTGGDGNYSVILDVKPKAGRWYVYVINADGNAVSPRVVIETDEVECQPTGTGKQNFKVNFRKG